MGSCASCCNRAYWSHAMPNYEISVNGAYAYPAIKQTPDHVFKSHLINFYDNICKLKIHQSDPCRDNITNRRQCIAFYMSNEWDTSTDFDSFCISMKFDLLNHYRLADKKLPKEIIYVSNSINSMCAYDVPLSKVQNYGIKFKKMYIAYNVIHNDDGLPIIVPHTIIGKLQSDEYFYVQINYDVTRCHTYNYYDIYYGNNALNICMTCYGRNNDHRSNDCRNDYNCKCNRTSTLDQMDCCKCGMLHPHGSLSSCDCNYCRTGNYRYCRKCDMHYSKYDNHCCECKMDWNSLNKHCCKCKINYSKYDDSRQIVHCCKYSAKFVQKTCYKCQYVYGTDALCNCDAVYDMYFCEKCGMKYDEGHCCECKMNYSIDKCCFFDGNSICETATYHCCKCKINHRKKYCCDCKIEYSGKHCCKCRMDYYHNHCCDCGTDHIFEHCCDCNMNYYHKHCCGCKMNYHNNAKHCCDCKIVYDYNHCCKCKVNYDRHTKHRCEYNNAHMPDDTDPHSCKICETPDVTLENHYQPLCLIQYDDCIICTKCKTQLKSCPYCRNTDLQFHMVNVKVSP